MRVLGLLVLPLLMLCVACGDDFATLEPRNPAKAADGLVFTRADGSSYEIQDAVATCFAAEQKPGLEVVRLTAPTAATQGGSKWPWFMVEVVPGTTGTFRLPLKERDWEAGPPDVTVFALDPRRHNELSGSMEEATGQVTVREATCDPEPRLSVRIDGRLASEIGLPSVHVVGGMASTGK
jgi:hypothetical protein